MDYSRFEDQILINLLVDKDENALGELYDRYGRLVFSISLNSISDPSLAEEITQDVFLRLWKNASSYRSEYGKVATWIASITRNRAIDEIRRMNVRPESRLTSWEFTDLELRENSLDVESQIELLQQQNRVRRAISQLPEEQRQVLALAYFQGYTHREIAEIMNQPLGTVKTRIRLAMNKLRSSLEYEI